MLRSSSPDLLSPTLSFQIQRFGGGGQDLYGPPWTFLAWAEAYRRTPHGASVELAAARQPLVAEAERENDRQADKERRRLEDDTGHIGHHIQLDQNRIIKQGTNYGEKATS